MTNVVNSTGGGTGVAVDEGSSRDASPLARKAAWTAIVLVGLLFSYSIGWQKGWMVGNHDTDARFKNINQNLKDARIGALGSTGATADSAEDPADSA